MRITASLLGLLGLTALAASSKAPTRGPRDYDANSYYLLELDSTVQPSDVAQRLGLTHEGELPQLAGHHVFFAPKHDEDIVKEAVVARRSLRKRGISEPDAIDGVKFTKKQLPKRRHEKRVIPPKPVILPLTAEEAYEEDQKRRITLNGEKAYDGPSFNVDGIRKPVQGLKHGQRHGDAKRSDGKAYNGPLHDFHAPRVPIPKNSRDSESGGAHKRGVIPTYDPRQSLGEFKFGQGQSEASQEMLVAQAELASKLEISDPNFVDQWHLFNAVEVGNDVNVSSVWLAGITGHNSTVAIIDDGLDMYAKDLADNYFAEGSWDFNYNDPEPRPTLKEDTHGTRCAGEVAAGKNAYCGLGVAYDAKIAGIRILSKTISDVDEAEALNYAMDKNQIYSCSWGPMDDGQTMDAPSIVISRAMLNAIQKGRNGKGSIYVFASGNGAIHGDNCNFDGYTNSIYSVTVGAVDRKGMKPYYAERCSAQLVVTYSSGSGDGIHTTDVGENNCATKHGGTSAAAPLVAGIFALVLTQRPDLHWRDMQILAMETAVKIDSADDWQTTYAGRHYSHNFGYGKIDTWAIIEAAKTYKRVKPQAWYYSPWIYVEKVIPEGEEGIAATFVVTKEMLKEANLEKVEHVTVTMNVNHTRRGDLSVDLISPEGVISHLAEPRPNDASTDGYQMWTFMSVVHWGEPGLGAWKLIVRDTSINSLTGYWSDFHLKLWGESIDASKAYLLPLPSDDQSSDEEHDGTGAPLPKPSWGVAAPVHSTKVPPAKTGTASAGGEVGGETEVPERPVPPKIQPSPARFSTSLTTMPSSPTDSPQPENAEGDGAGEKSTWLSWLPSFGFGSKTVAWVYGSLALIVSFCIGLGVYFYISKRKREREGRDGYEFEVLRDEEEGDGLVGGGKGKGAAAGKRRAGELYDAFAEGSDDDLGLSDSDDEDDRRRDQIYKDQAGESSEGLSGTTAGSASRSAGAGGAQQFGKSQKRQLDMNDPVEQERERRFEMEREAHVLGGDSDDESGHSGDDGERGDKGKK